jgi:hypothetical protein
MPALQITLYYFSKLITDSIDKMKRCVQMQGLTMLWDLLKITFIRKCS